MNARIVIAGAGGFGREVHAWLQTSPAFLAKLQVDAIAFINDVPPPRALPAPVVGNIADYVPGEADLFICAVGAPDGRRSVVESLKLRGARFATFIHDSVILGENVHLGEGCVICPGAILTSDIQIAEQVHININCSVGHDVSIGPFVTLSPACNLMGEATAEQDVFFGTGVTVVPGRTVHRGTSIGAGSVVVKDIEAGVLAFGNPCKTVRRLDD